MGFFSKKSCNQKGDKALEKMGLGHEPGTTEGENKMLEGGEFVYIRTESIRPNPFQPRRNFDEESLRSLAESLRQDGMLQPLTVKKTPDDADGFAENHHCEFTLLAGERRWRAAKLAELEKVPAIVRSAKKSEMRRLALVENIQREGLNIVEMTRSIGELNTELGDTASVTKALGLSERSIQRYLKIYKVIYADRALTSLFERQAMEIDLKTALRLATLAESITRSGKARELFDRANSMGLKDALISMIRALDDDKNLAEEKVRVPYSIATRKNTLVFTVRYSKDQVISPEDKRHVQNGFREFLKQLEGQPTENIES